VAGCFKLIPVFKLEQARLVFPVLVLGADPGPGEVAHKLFDVLLEGPDTLIIAGHDDLVLLDQDVLEDFHHVGLRDVREGEDGVHETREATALRHEGDESVLTNVFSHCVTEVEKTSTALKHNLHVGYDKTIALLVPSPQRLFGNYSIEFNYC
jgi:hypothetical protein